LKVRLYMEAQNLPPATSRNTIAEIKGKSNPEEVVIVSGHLDSWDVGQGAMDDGGGAFVSWVSVAAIKSLGLRPKRTLRAILWTAEEEGLIGADVSALSIFYPTIFFKNNRKLLNIHILSV
jgi:carboxypeptidase Q